MASVREQILATLTQRLAALGVVHSVVRFASSQATAEAFAAGKCVVEVLADDDEPEGQEHYSLEAFSFSVILTAIMPLPNDAGVYPLDPDAVYIALYGTYAPVDKMTFGGLAVNTRHTGGGSVIDTQEGAEMAVSLDIHYRCTRGNLEEAR